MMSEQSVESECPVETSSLFDRWHWLYAFFRERLFANHTDAIAELMQSRSHDGPGPTFVELGCGPGFYSAKLARRFPQWEIVGLDSSAKLLKRARRRVAQLGLKNCTFEMGDATRLTGSPERAGFVLASRLLLVLQARSESLNGIYNLLRPGGALLIAEPKENWRTGLPIHCMKALDRLTTVHPRRQEVEDNRTLTFEELDALLRGQAWWKIRRWSDSRYQYAFCEKAVVETVDGSCTAEHGRRRDTAGTTAKVA